MSEDRQEQIAQQPTIGDSSKEDKKSRNWWIDIVSVITVGYLVFSLISPMFLKQGQQPPRKIEKPDLILIALILLFNSGLLNRLEDFGFFGLCYAMNGGCKRWNPYRERHLAIFVNCFCSRAN